MAEVPTMPTDPAIRTLAVALFLFLFLFLFLSLSLAAHAAEEPQLQPEGAGGPVLAEPETARALASCPGEVCGLRFAPPAFPPPLCVVASPVAGAAAPSCAAPGAVAFAAAAGLAAERLIDGRGTSRCQGLRVPSIGCCPLWRGLASEGDLLVGGYGLGLRTFGIGGSHANAPKVLDTADGVETCTLGSPGDPTATPPVPPLAPTSSWLAFGIVCRGTSEQLAFVKGVDTHPLPGGSALVAAAATTPVGVSLWRMSSGGVLSAVYQRGALRADDVLAFELAGRVYVLTLHGVGGAHLLDGTAALARTVPACEECTGTGVRLPGTATSAPGVYLGQLPGVGSASRYAALLIRDGRVFVALTSQVGSPVGIWELRPRLGDDGPLDPSRTIRRTPAFSTLPPSRGIGWLPGSTVLAGISGGEVVARDWGPCLAAGGCTTPPPVAWSHPIPNTAAAERTLDVSALDDRAVLYAGVLGSGDLGGPRLDAMVEVVDGRPTRDLLAGAGTYQDSCSNKTVDFWGYMNPRNRFGLNNYQPHRAVCRGGLCYHSAEGTLFVSRLPPLAPTEDVFADGFEGGDTSRWARAMGVNP